MRLLVAAALLALVISAVLAPPIRSERRNAAEAGAFADLDPVLRAEEGERELALGTAFSGYAELLTRDPGNRHALRGRIRAGLRLGAAAFGQPFLERLISEQIEEYMARRGEIDPDGVFLQECLTDWVEIRREHPSWYAQAATAIYLAARDRKEGLDKLVYYANSGRFEGEYFRYVRRNHVRWPSVRTMLLHYLERGDLAGIVQGGAALLDYHRLFGVGRDLLERHKDRIREAFIEAKAGLGTAAPGLMQLNLGEAALIGLAMLGEPQDKAVIAALRPEMYRNFADLVRIVRIWAGVDPLDTYRLGGLQWNLLRPSVQEHYFRAAAQRMLALGRTDVASMPPKQREKHAAALREAREIVDAALIAPQDPVRIYATLALCIHAPDRAPELLARSMQGGGVLAIHAACLADLADPVPVLLPGLRSGEADISVMVAIAMLDLDAPSPMQPYAPDG